MSSTSDALRVIELTAARLREDIGALAEPLDRRSADDRTVPQAPQAPLPDPAAGKLPADPNWRMKLQRAAWDPNSSQPLTPDYVCALAAGLPADVTVDPTGLDHSCVFPPPVGRIVLNLLLLAAESLPMGGTVRLAGSADDLFLQIAGPGAAWPAGMAACVVDEAVAVAAIKQTALTGTNGAQMPLTALLAHTSGVRLSFLLGSSNRAEPPLLRLGGA